MAFPEDYKVAKNVEVVYDEATNNHYLRIIEDGSNASLQVKDVYNFMDEARISFDFNGVGNVSDYHFLNLDLFGSGYVDGSSDSLYELQLETANNEWIYQLIRMSDNNVLFYDIISETAPTGFVNFSIEWWKENDGYWMALYFKGVKKYEMSISPTNFGWWFDTYHGGWQLDNIKVYRRWI